MSWRGWEYQEMLRALGKAGAACLAGNERRWDAASAVAKGSQKTILRFPTAAGLDVQIELRFSATVRLGDPTKTTNWTLYPRLSGSYDSPSSLPSIVNVLIVGYQHYTTTAPYRIQNKTRNYTRLFFFFYFLSPQSITYLFCNA